MSGSEIAVTTLECDWVCVVTRSTIGVDEGDHEDDVSIEISPSCLLPPCKQSRNLRDEMKVDSPKLQILATFMFLFMHFRDIYNYFCWCIKISFNSHMLFASSLEPITHNSYFSATKMWQWSWSIDKMSNLQSIIKKSNESWRNSFDIAIFDIGSFVFFFLSIAIPWISFELPPCLVKP